jgi:outer membrane protein insertion porin family
VRLVALAAVLAACAGAPKPAAPRIASEPELAALEGARLATVELTGAGELLRRPLLAQLASRPGGALHREAVAGDVRRLWDSGAFADVAVFARGVPGGGVALSFAVAERPLVRRAWLEGDPPPSGARRIGGLAGGLYDPARLHRMAARLRESFLRAGHRRAAVSLQVTPAGRRVDVCFRAAAGPRYLLDTIEFTGARRMSAAELAAGIQTHGGAVNAAGAPYREDLLAEDLARIPTLYYDLGHIDVQVGPPRVAVDQARRRLRVVVPVREGAVYRLRRVSLPAQLSRQRRRYLAALGVRPGEPFSRARLVAGMERVQALAHRLTGASVALVPETAIDADRHLIDIDFAIEAPR